jgi:uncharacterized protein (DUF58 family)
LIAPTARAAAAAAVGAPLALAIGVARPELWWLVLVWLGGLLLVAAVEAALLPRSGKVAVKLTSPLKVSVGEAFHLAVSISAQARLRRVGIVLSVDQRLEGTGAGYVDIALDHGHGVADFALTAHRRGLAPVGPVDLRWTGWLGLVARFHRAATGVEILITPDVRHISSDALALLAEDSGEGQSRQPWLGHSGVFEALTEFRDGIDRRHVDWKASARHAMLLAKEHRAERDNAIVLAVDCGRLMCEPLDGLTRVDRAVTAALLTGYVALRSGDRVGLFAFDARPRQVAVPRSGVSSFASLQRAAGGIHYAFEETNFALSLSDLGRRLDRRSLVILFTEFVDTTSAELMLRVTGQLRRRHLVVAVVFRDFELETIVAAQPKDADDIARSVMAAGLLQERKLVLARLRKLGIDVVEGAHAEIGPRLVKHYLEIKAQRRL